MPLSASTKGSGGQLHFGIEMQIVFFSYSDSDLQSIMSSVKMYFQTSIESFENVSFESVAM